MAKDIREMIDKIKGFKLNESNDVLCELVDGEIKVYENKIKELLNNIGEGIDDIRVEKYQNDDTYQNEIIVTFIDNAWGGLNYDDWKKVETLDNYIDDNFVDYSINTTKNTVTLEFADDFEMGLY